MPSNKVRGAITQWVTAVCELPAIRYGFTAVMLLNLFYFYFVMDALLHPFYDLGFLSPLDNAPTCESKVGARWAFRVLAPCRGRRAAPPTLLQRSSAMSGTPTSPASPSSCSSFSAG